MNINQIEITGFKGIPNLVIHPKQINILVGKNNTGKTSILEAINCTIEASMFSMQHTYKPHLSSFINVNKKEAKVLIKLENENKYLLLSKPELTEIIPEFKKQLLTITKSISQPRQISEAEWKKVDELIDRILSNEDLLHKIDDKSIRIESEGKKSYILSYPPTIAKELEQVTDYVNKNMFHGRGPPLLFFLMQPHRYFSLSTDETAVKTLAFIKRLTVNETLLSSLNKSKISEIENYLKERNILENLERFDIDRLLFKNSEKEYEIPFSFMGEGFKALIGLFVQIPKEVKIVLIEEPENHMHPAYTEEIIRQIIDFSIINRVQFFITTHNSDILDLVSTDTLEPKYQEYLSNELNLIRLDSFDNEIVVQELDKKEALEELEDLKIDLRGK